jgi:hypothetical protein
MSSECTFSLIRGFAEIRQYVGDTVNAPGGTILRAISEAEELLRVLFGELPPTRSKAAGECRTAAKLVQDYLSNQNVDSELLAGYVRVGEQEWLEHYVLLIRTSDVWVCADFSAAQIPWFEGTDCITVLTSPNLDCLEFALHTEYRWWIPGFNS